MAQVHLFPGVIVDIINGTTLEGLQPSTLALLEAAGQAALAAGLSHIQVTAGAGHEGHVSHYDGTEADMVGFNPDGSRWTQDQRVAVAGGARGAGANRFGFYSNPDGSFSGNSLHIGTGPGGRNQNVTWGYGGQTSGDASRGFTHAGEAQFSAEVVGGVPGARPQHGAPARQAPMPNGTPASPVMAENVPAAPPTPIADAIVRVGQAFSAQQGQNAPNQAEIPQTPRLAATDFAENSRNRLAEMTATLMPAPETGLGAAEAPMRAFNQPFAEMTQKPDPFKPLFGPARSAPLGGGTRIRA